MEHLNLLILEDNDIDFSKIHASSIEAFNKYDKGVNFIFPETRVRTIEDAQSLLSSDLTFHSAIVDLKLAQEPADSGKGNKLVELIIEKYRIPIFVYSNNLSLLDPKFEEYKGFFLNSYLKGQKNFLEILKEIKGINETGIIEILSKRGHIENILDKVFWKHISTSLGNWIKINQTKKEKEKMLLRHVSEYISQYLGINEDTGEFEMYDKAEFYTVPPIKGQLFTGDILYKNSTDEYFIVLTPACDLAQNKAKKILLANIIPSNVLLANITPNNKGTISTLVGTIKKIEKQNKKDEKKEEYETAKEDLLKLVSNNYSPKYYFLPRTEELEGGLINFHEITSIRKNLIDSDYERKASIASPFLKDIIAKFSYYYSRQGAPDFNCEDICKELINEKAINN